MERNRKIFGAVFIALMAGMVCLPSGRMVADDVVIGDSTLMVIKLKSLNVRKAELEKQIKIEDGKRNRTIAGVSPESAERMNIVQDSICLELRSQLVSVNLEIEEKTNNK